MLKKRLCFPQRSTFLLGGTEKCILRHFAIKRRFFPSERISASRVFSYRKNAIRTFYSKKTPFPAHCAAMLLRNFCFLLIRDKYISFYCGVASHKVIEPISHTAINFSVFLRLSPCKVPTCLRQNPKKSIKNLFAVWCEAVLKE